MTEHVATEVSPNHFRVERVEGGLVLAFLTEEIVRRCYRSVTFVYLSK